MSELSLSLLNLIPNEFDKCLDLIYVDTSSKCSVIHKDPFVLPEDSYHPALKISVEIIGNVRDSNHQTTSFCTRYNFAKTKHFKTRKNANFGCTEAIIPFSNMKVLYKNLIPIVQFVWKLYAIEIWSIRFLRIFSYCLK